MTAIGEEDLTKAELKALAMHELMKREQARYANRINQQRKLERFSDEKLRSIVNGGGDDQSNKEGVQ